MPFLLENITVVAAWLVVAVLIAIALIVAAALLRRRMRARYFMRLDAERAKAQPVLQGLFQNKVPYEKAVADLRNRGDSYRQLAIQELILTATADAATMAVARRLCEDLGYVERWITTLGKVKPRQRNGKPSGGFAPRLQLWWDMALAVLPGHYGFLARALAAENLGRVRVERAVPSLLAALDDPHVDVRNVAIRSLGQIREVKSLPSLLRVLEEVIKAQQEVSLRTIKSALVQFPLSAVGQFESSLHHAHQRIRFFVTDVVREIVEREIQGGYDFVAQRDFPPGVYKAFVEQLWKDGFADVRARAAAVLSYFLEMRTSQILSDLMEDPQWFVRLHTVRALGKPFYQPVLPRMVRCLQDPHWMVREATVRTMESFGAAGVSQLLDSLLATEDNYAREQIMEELQRGGLIPSIIEQLDGPAPEKAIEVLQLFVSLRKTSLIQNALESHRAPTVRLTLAGILAAAIDQEVLETLQGVAKNDPAPMVRETAADSAQRVAARLRKLREARA